MLDLFISVDFFAGIFSFLDSLPGILSQALKNATPLIFVAMAGLLCERSGVVDIGLEGKILISAFASAITSYAVAQHMGPLSLGGIYIPIAAIAGLLMAILASMLMALVHAYASVSKGGDQVVSGVAINFFASGFTVVVTNALYGTADTKTIASGSGGLFPRIQLPFVEVIETWPIIGPFYTGVLNNQNILTWLAFLVVPFVAWVLYRTRFGLRLRAVGENPQAVDTAGMSVANLRYRAVILGGALCGFAGTYLAIGASSQFIREMSSGRGYIALVVLILGKWKPIPTLLGCLLFGFLQSTVDRWIPQTKNWIDLGNITPLTDVLPYILVLVIMFFVGKSRAPAAIGTPYKKER